MTFPFPIASTRKVELTFRANTTDGTDLTTYTFASQAIGPASPNREVVVTLGSRANSARTIVSVTIGGITATAVATANNATGGCDIAAIYKAAVPTGTTASIVITFSGAMLRCGIGVYSLKQAKATAAATSTVTPSGTSPTTTITVPSNGAVLAVAWGNSSGTYSVTWTGPTEDYDATVETASNGGSGSSENYNTTQTAMTITATVAGVTIDQAMAVVAWGP